MYSFLCLHKIFYTTSGTVMIVRKNEQIFDYVLPHEKVRDDEVVAVERVVDVLEELYHF
uniref:competence regulator inhibitor paratox n=1 Tax=Streptococcus agalactiae TaxID=1311 RepID=UPI0009A176B7|nr:Paratox [Streptococcus agalactiae]